MADRTPVALALLADAMQARAADSPDDHDLHALADGVALAVDHGAAAALWPPTSQDDADVEWISSQWKFIDAGLGREDHVTSATRSLEVRIARRLADVAASLRVRGDGMRREAEALWRAASRLLGLEDEPRERVDRDRLQAHVDLAAAMAQRDPQMTYVATDRGVVVESRAEHVRMFDDLRADLASMTEQRDLLKRQLEDLRAETRKTALPRVDPGGTGRKPSPIPTFEAQTKAFRENNPPDEPNPDNRDSYRGTVLRAGAKDCALFIGPGPSDLTFVVEMREGAKVFDVAAALAHEHGLEPGAYRIREVRTPTEVPR